MRGGLLFLISCLQYNYKTNKYNQNKLTIEHANDLPEANACSVSLHRVMTELRKQNSAELGKSSSLSLTDPLLAPTNDSHHIGAYSTGRHVIAQISAG